ncbi:MAG: aminoacyl-histidine dipeptidase [Clostridia bacterium]|nr:aminoacyl-histidine dipeptidase [Clostridia bacterium]
MEYILNNYEPIALFHYFEEISAIPRGSGNEKGIADYLCAFAESQGLRYYRDELHNVAIFKDAAPGYEEKEAVMLQGHTDMVCEKNSDVVHDFEKEGIKLIEKDGMLMAEGTTLGADNGVAVALMLTVLADKSLEAPALECLFTVQEETGLGGAEFFDYSKLSARRIINLDTESESEAIASCAGSMNLSFKIAPDYLPFKNQSIKVTVKGLAGGHSGTDIDSGRRNSIMLLGQLLSAYYEVMPFNLVSLEGGNKRNAIPREAEAILSVVDREEAIAQLKKLSSVYYPLLVEEDEGLKIRVDKCAKPERMMSYADTSRVLSLLTLVPNGVLGMSAGKKGLVESSSNLGVVHTYEKELEFSVYSRSSVESEMDRIYTAMKRMAKLVGAELVFLDRCPGWAFNKNSKLQKDFVKAYKKTFPQGAEPRVEAIHAGLECGIIIEKMGGGDAISFGPNMKDIHTPGETLDLHSLERVYCLLINLLKL